MKEYLLRLWHVVLFFGITIGLAALLGDYINVLWTWFVAAVAIAYLENDLNFGE
jgi:hypothetical protein